jgi:HK97 family phage major capsid protein
VPVMDEEQFSELRRSTRNLWGPRSPDAIAERRADLAARQDQLLAYVHRSQPQETEFEANVAEIGFLDELLGERKVAEYKEQLARTLRRVAEHPELCESGDGGGERGAPAYIPKLGAAETPAQTISRMGANPWRNHDGVVSGGDSAAGVIARAHTALEGLESALTRDGCEKLAQAMSEQTSWPGVTMKRSRDEQAEAAELWLALSNPHYAEAFRTVLRYPGEFTGLGGTGFETLTDEQRQAWRDVRTNSLCRAAFAESSGAVGAFAIPLDLHPDIILTNAGSANPFRKLARTVLSTTNVAEFVTSAGSTANWVAEGAAVADTTPAIGQLAVTHYRESVWIYGSFEVLQDTELGRQVPALIADAKDRLEVVAFTTGTGSAQPFGVIAHGTSDASVGALTAAMVYGLHNALPPRFRVGDNAKPIWIANVAIMNALRQLPAFTGAVNAILVDATNDSIPEVLGADIYECSAMDALNVTSGHKNLALLDMNSFIITNRQPEMLIYEPLFKDQATGRPSGQAGWFSWSRVGSDLTTATACQYHTT